MKCNSVTNVTDALSKVANGLMAVLDLHTVEPTAAGLWQYATHFDRFMMYCRTPWAGGSTP